MSLSVESLKDRYLALVSRDEGHFMRLLNEAEARLQETAKWNWTKAEEELEVVEGLIYLDPSLYAALLGVIVDDGARIIRPREVEFSPNSFNRAEANKPGQGHLVDCGIVKLTVSVSTPQTVTISGVTINGTALDPLVLQYVGVVDGSDRWSGQVPGAPNAATVGRPGVVEFFFEDLTHEDPEEVPGWRIYIDDSETYFAAAPAAIGISINDITGWVVYEGGGTPAVTASGSEVRRRKYKVADTVRDGLVECLLLRAHTTLTTDEDFTLCPSARALKLAMLAVGYEEVDDAERAKTYWAESYAALNEQEVTQRGGVRGSVSIQPFGDGVRPVGSLM